MSSRLIKKTLAIALIGATAATAAIANGSAANSSPLSSSAASGRPGNIPVGVKARLAGRSPADLVHVVSELRDAGVTHVREDVSWARIEPRQGSFDWSSMDRWVGESARQGLEIIALPSDPPPWATPHWSVAPSKGDALAGFAKFVRALVERYGTSGAYWRLHPEIQPRPIRYWNIWNEPYVSTFWSRNFPDPAGYARMFKTVVEAARPADPKARFLLEADTRVIAPGGVYKPFLTRMLEAVPDLGDYAYAVSVHPYQGDGGSPRECTPSHTRGAKSGWRATALQFCRIADIRKILDASGAGNVRIWITEIGWSTAVGGPRSVSEAEQAENVREVFALLRTTYSDVVSGIVWYEYQGTEADETVEDDNYGLVHADGSPKPAWRALVDEIPTISPSRPRGQRTDT